MIHPIDHDRIQSCSAGALEKKKEKLFGEFLCVLDGTSNRLLIFVCLFGFGPGGAEVARVVAKVRLRGLALPSPAASGRRHRRRRRLQFHLRAAGARVQQSTHFHLLFERHYPS